MIFRLTRTIIGLALLTILVGCGTPASGGQAGGAASGAQTGSTVAGQAAGGATTITLGAYTTPREAYAKIIPMFQTYWKEQSGQDVSFEQSYLGSGAQSRAIVEGFDADVAALSLEADIARIAEAGLITHDWKAKQNNGMVSTSVVAFAVRRGNPKGIKDWADLAKPGIEILTPDPKTSGGAQWNIMALYGAALRGNVEGVAKGDEAAAQDFMKRVLKNVSVMDKAARESITNFEKGVGDVAITYENEVLVALQSGQEMDMVIPRSTILIENPVALIDSSVDKHGNRKAVEAFIEFLFTPDAQRVFAENGLRSIDQGVAQATSAQYPAIGDLFTINEFGGWKEVTPKFFGESGVYTVAVAEVQQ